MESRHVGHGLPASRFARSVRRHPCQPALHAGMTQSKSGTKTDRGASPPLVFEGHERFGYFWLQLRCSSCPSLAAYTIACLAGESPATGIGCLPV